MSDRFLLDAEPPANEPQSSLEDEPLFRYFDFQHLPHNQLRGTSSIFQELAAELIRRLPRSAERTVALRKLLEAKDSAVRATVDLLKEAQ